MMEINTVQQIHVQNEYKVCYVSNNSSSLLESTYRDFRADLITTDGTAQVMAIYI